MVVGSARPQTRNWAREQKRKKKRKVIPFSFFIFYSAAMSSTNRHPSHHEFWFVAHDCECWLQAPPCVNIRAIITTASKFQTEQLQRCEIYQFLFISSMFSIYIKLHKLHSQVIVSICPSKRRHTPKKRQPERKGERQRERERESESSQGNSLAFCLQETASNSSESKTKRKCFLCMRRVLSVHDSWFMNLKSVCFPATEYKCGSTSACLACTMRAARNCKREKYVVFRCAPCMGESFWELFGSEWDTHMHMTIIYLLSATQLKSNHSLIAEVILPLAEEEKKIRIRKARAHTLRPYCVWGGGGCFYCISYQMFSNMFLTVVYKFIIILWRA